MSRFSAATIIVAPKKIPAAIVITDEVLRFSSPSAELSLGRELAGAVGLATDRRFIDPDVAGSISNGASVINSSGSTLAAIDSDLKLLLAVFSGADSALDRVTLAMSSKTATYLAALRGSGGASAFPNVGAKGGNIWGAPVVVSDALIASGSPGEGEIVAFDPAQILLADDAQIDVSVARSASIQLDDAPSGAASQEISLFQANLVGILAERWVGWQRVATTSVAVLDNVTY